MDYRDDRCDFSEFDAYPSEPKEPVLSKTFNDGLWFGMLIGFVFGIVLFAVFNQMAKGNL